MALTRGTPRAWPHTGPFHRLVRTREYQGFPLIYHWRVLTDSPPEGFGGVDGAVANWEGSPAVRERLEAVGRSSSSLVTPGSSTGTARSP